MNITDYSMNVSCDVGFARLFIFFYLCGVARSLRFYGCGVYVATKWTRRDLNPRPPALLESLELSLQSGCSTGLSYAPVIMKEEVPVLTPIQLYFLCKKKIGGDPSAGSPTDTL